MKKAGTFLIALVTLGTACAGQGPDAAARIKAEIQRLQLAAKAKPAADANWKNLLPALERVLARAERNADAGRLYLSLEDLSTARQAFRSVEAVKEKPAVAQGDLAGFEKEWRAVRGELAALDKTARAQSWGKTPAALRALSEAEQGTTMVLIDASLAYAGASSVADGMAGIGEAQAASQSAAFSSSLGLTSSSTPLPLRSVSPELRRMQQRVNDAFKPPRSIELHSRFIRLNATLKLAGELDAAGLHAGALYTYLDGVQQFALFDAAAPDEVQQTRLRQAVAAARTATDKAQRDDSISLIFLERAEAAMAGAPDTPPTPDDWKKAAAIVDQVLPAYQDVLRAPPVPETKIASAVTVTLVRWPYT